MTPPKRLLIVSDGNELELIETKKLKTGIQFEYRYTKSETKLGLILPLPEEQLLKMINNNIAKPL